LTLWLERYLSCETSFKRVGGHSVSQNCPGQSKSLRSVKIARQVKVCIPLDRDILISLCQSTKSKLSNDPSCSTFGDHLVNEVQLSSLMVQTVQANGYLQLWAYVSSSYGCHFVHFLDSSGNYFNMLQ